MEAYEEFLKDVAKRNKPLPENIEFWNKLLVNNLLDNRKLNRLFNDFLDFVIDHTEVSSKEIEFFGYGLFKHSSNIFKDHLKADEFIRKIMIPLDNNLNLFDKLLSNFTNEIIQLINASSGDYNQDLSELLTLSKENNSLNNELINKIFSDTTLSEVIKKIDDSESKVE